MKQRLALIRLILASGGGRQKGWLSLTSGEGERVELFPVTKQGLVKPRHEQGGLLHAHLFVTSEEVPVWRGGGPLCHRSSRPPA
jgi:hypothetical protein